MEEELTDKMHATFWVDDETDLKHRVWAACRVVFNGARTLPEALDDLGLSLAD